MELFSIENLFTLMMLILLQAVLGFDNLLYISLESKRVEPSQQRRVRRLGIGLAIVLRIVLLFAILGLIQYVQNPLFGIHIGEWIHSDFNLHSLIVLAGGVFIMYTAIKEVWHMTNYEPHHASQASPKSTAAAITAIVVMNAIFSIDSILSAIALTDVFIVMAVAIVIGGILMIWLADHIAEFLKRNRMYEVLGLFILLVVGIMLITEGAHLAHLSLFGHPIEPMTKSTFYFVIAVLVLTDLVQSRYQRRLLRAADAQQQAAATN